MSELQGFTVALIQKEDYDEVMKLLRRTFFVDEPLNRTLGVCKSESESCPELEEFCSSSLDEGISLKAVDNKGTIVGVLINEMCPITEEIGVALAKKAEASNDPKFKKILHILALRETGARLWEKFPGEDKLVEVKVAATDPKWRNRGILNTLAKETENLLKQRGVRIMRLDSSSAYSAKTAERLGFTCFYKVPYTEIQLNGEPLVVPEPPHIYDRVFVKKLFE